MRARSESRTGPKGDGNSWTDLAEGRLAYVHVAGYNAKGVLDFWRGYYGGADRPGLIIDQRFNGGGVTSDALIEMLAREPLYYYLFREGPDIAMPLNPAPVAKVLLINEWNGSAAETFALMFRLGRIGEIVRETDLWRRGSGPMVASRDSSTVVGSRFPTAALSIPRAIGALRIRASPRISRLTSRPPTIARAGTANWRKRFGWRLERIDKEPSSRRKRPGFPIYP